jgi:Fe-S cluster assembly scaffold protein SufB
MQKVDHKGEFEAIVETFECGGGNSAVFGKPDASFLVVSGNTVLTKNVGKGVEIDITEGDEEVEVFLSVGDNRTIERPVHLCFGVVKPEGRQYIRSRYTIGNNASVRFLAHCSFPRAEDVLHVMDADIAIGENSVVRYNEVHFHGPEGGIEVVPKGKVSVGTRSSFFSEFKIVDGAVGRFDMDYNVSVGAHGVAELIAKLYGKKEDRIKIKESIYLNGNYSRGIAKTRIVNKDSSKSEVLGEVIGNGDHARGHIDCTEIIEGECAEARAVPLIKVTNPLAKVTHEAAIGSVDKNQVETLMARGLEENEAIDMIVRGILK